MEEDSSVFVRVDEHLYLRKDIIRTIIESEELKKSELKIRRIRQAKMIEISKLKNIINVIASNIEFLDKDALPKEEKQEIQERQVELKPLKINKKIDEKTKKEVKSLSELDRLRLELNEIDTKLRSLEF